MTNPIKRLVCFFKGHEWSDHAINKKGDFGCERCGKTRSLRDLMEKGRSINIVCSHCGQWTGIVREGLLMEKLQLFKDPFKADKHSKDGQYEKDKGMDYIQ